MAGCGHTASDHERRLIEAMTPKTQEDRFWRSPEGAERYEDVLEAHYAHLLATIKHKSLRDLPHPTCDVLVLEDAGGDGDFLAITKGLSGFILGPPCHAEARICFRQEFALSFRDAAATDGVVAFLLELADHVLSGRRWYSIGEALRGIDFAKYFGHACTPTAVAFTQGWCLPEESQGVIANHFEGLVMELYAITDREADWLEDDQEAFYDAVEASDVDFLDMQRASFVSSPPAR